MLITAADTATPVRAPSPDAAENAVKARRGPERDPEREPAARARVADSDNKAQAEIPLERPSHYRLIYDKEFSRTFIQIVDRSSGEEILRFPPEELVKFIDDSIGRINGGSTSGLFVDRSI